MDIEEPLYKYCMFYRYDVNNRIVTKTQLFKQKCKAFAVILLQMAHICRYLLYFNKIKPNQNLPVYYFYIMQYFGAFKEFICIGTILCINITIWFIVILNNCSQNHYKWFDIIAAINGYKTLLSIGLRIDI